MEAIKIRPHPVLGDLIGGESLELVRAARAAFIAEELAEEAALEAAAALRAKAGRGIPESPATVAAEVMPETW